MRRLWNRYVAGGLDKRPRPDCQRPSGRHCRAKPAGIGPQARRGCVAHECGRTSPRARDQPARGTAAARGGAPPRRTAAARAEAHGRCCSLIPYVGRYRGRALAALAALLVAALATLAVPLAVRRMIDFGFTAPGPEPDRQLFRGDDRGRRRARVASAARYYLVITLGERIVADLRSDVFNHLTVALGLLFRPGQDRRDPLAAHRRHHADQVRGRLVGVGRAAQHRAVRRRRHHDGDHEPAAVPLRAPRDPGDRAAALRLRARDPATLARRAGHARRRLGLCRRTARRRAHAAGLHQRGAGARPLRGRGRARLRGRQERDRRARGADRDRDLPGVRQRRAWCCGSARRTSRGRHHARTARRSSCSMRCSRRAALGQLSEVWGELRRRPAPPSGCSRS